MVIAIREKNESDEALLKRFLKKVNASGILQECKDRQAYMKPSDKRRAEKMASKSRIKRDKKKEQEQANFENDNKFRPKKVEPRNNQKDRKFDKRKDNRPKVKEVKVQEPPKDAPTQEALKSLQDKFNKK